MHDTAFLTGRLFLETYAALPGASIVEIGAMDVNGSLRDAAPAGCTYVGLDIAPGRGVDVVVEPGAALPFDDGQVDAVLASSVFEHDPAFWLTFREMCRITKPGGHVYVSAPSNGMVHRYPTDCWRFYPDAGLALAAASKRQGMAVTLIESFVADRVNDRWNDFVAVFQRDGGGVRMTERLHRRVACRFVHDVDAPPEMPIEADTQDMEIIAGLQARAAAPPQSPVRTVVHTVVRTGAGLAVTPPPATRIRRHPVWTARR